MPLSPSDGSNHILGCDAEEVPKVQTNQYNPIIRAKPPILSGDWRKALLVKNKGAFRTAKLSHS